MSLRGTNCEETDIMLDYCGGWDKCACWFLGQMSKYMVNRETCVVLASFQQSQTRLEEGLLLLDMELKMVSLTRGGNVEDMLSHGMITWLMSLEGQGN